MPRNKQKDHEYYLQNREKILAKDKENYALNKKDILIRSKKWQKDNREYFYEYQRKWREKRRLKNLKQNPKRKQLKKNEYPLYKKRFGDLRERVIERDNYKCVDCGLTRKEHIELYGVDITVDHKNGKGRYAEKPDNRMQNLVTRCLKCHGKKDQKMKHV